jgi:hypothetical protein
MGAGTAGIGWLERTRILSPMEGRLVLGRGRVSLPGEIAPRCLSTSPKTEQTALWPSQFARGLSARTHISFKAPDPY